jgi:hypothetical protein
MEQANNINTKQETYHAKQRCIDSLAFKPTHAYQFGKISTQPLKMKT